MNGRLILVKHSLPEIKKGLPAREWTLSEEGRARAERLAASLIHYQPEIMATSPEPKAKETAEIVARSLQLPVQIIDDFHEHERSFVSYLPQSEFEAAVRQFFEKPDTLVFGIETADAAYQRFSKAVFSVLAQNEHRKTIIVSHGTVISLFVSRLTGQAGFKIWSELGLPGFIVLDMPSRELIALENIL